MKIQNYKELPTDPLSTPHGLLPDSLKGYREIDPKLEVELLDMIHMCKQEKLELGEMQESTRQDYENAISWIMSGNIGFIHKKARPYVGNHVSFEDAYGTALIAAWRSIDAFDVERSRDIHMARNLEETGEETKPTALDIHKSLILYIGKSMRQEFNSLGYERTTVRLPRNAQEEITANRRHGKPLSDLGEKATRHLIADSIDPLHRLDGGHDIDLMPRSRRAAVDMLEADGYGSDPTKVVEDDELYDGIQKAMEGLTDREREIVRFRFGLEDEEPMTLDDIGRIYGLSRERIRQIKAKALEKLGHPNRSKHIKPEDDRLGKVWRAEDREHFRKPNEEYIRIKLRQVLGPIAQFAESNSQRIELHRAFLGIADITDPELLYRTVTAIEQGEIIFDEVVIPDNVDRLNPYIAELYDGNHYDGEIESLLHRLHYLQPTLQPGNFERSVDDLDLRIIGTIQQALRDYSKQTPGMVHDRSDLTWLKRLNEFAEVTDWYSVRMHLAHLLYEDTAKGLLDKQK